MSTIEWTIARILTAAYGFKQGEQGEQGQGMVEYGLV